MVRLRRMADPAGTLSARRRTSGGRAGAHCPGVAAMRPRSTQASRSSITPTSLRNDVSLASPAITFAWYTGLARAMSMPSVIPRCSNTVGSRLSATISATRSGATALHEPLLVGVQRGPALCQVALGEADMACFFENVEFADLADDRVESLVSHGGAVGVVEEFLDGEDREVGHGAPARTVLEFDGPSGAVGRASRPGGCTRRTSSNAGTRRRLR